MWDLFANIPGLLSILTDFESAISDSSHFGVDSPCKYVRIHSIVVFFLMHGQLGDMIQLERDKDIFFS